jgi:hypothetical protein
MPGFPDHCQPFMDTSYTARLGTSGGRFLYGPVLRRMRERSMRKHERIIDAELYAAFDEAEINRAKRVIGALVENRYRSLDAASEAPEPAA